MAYLSGDTGLRRWDDTTHLLANIVDLTQMTNSILWAAHLKGDPPKVEPVQRPGQPEDDTPAQKMDPVSIDYLNSFSPKASD